MTETSYNGYTAAPGWSVAGGQLEAVVVAGEPFSPGVRAGDVAVVLSYVAEQLNARVEPIVRPDWHQADDWGYSYRQNRNANNLSCHASGTAIDYNATRHPNGRRGTFTAAQVAVIRAILRDCRGVVRWGGDFTGTVDEMHWEIVGGPAQVADLATAIRAERAAGHPATQPAPAAAATPAPAAQPGPRTLSLTTPHMSGTDVGVLQRKLRDGYPAYRNESTVNRGAYLTVDLDYGPQTEAWVRLFQAKSGLTVDGAVGPRTRTVLGL